MSTAREARKNLALIRTFTKGLVALDEELGDMQDIETLIGQRKAELDGFEARIATAKATVQDAEKSASEAKARRAKEDEALQAAATASAERIKAAARAEAEKMRMAGEASITAAQAKVDEAVQSLVNVRQQVDDAKSCRDGVLAEVAAAEGRLKDLNAEIDRVRAKFG